MIHINAVRLGCAFIDEMFNKSIHFSHQMNDKLHTTITKTIELENKIQAYIVCFVVGVACVDQRFNFFENLFSYIVRLTNIAIISIESFDNVQLVRHGIFSEYY